MKDALDTQIQQLLQVAATPVPKGKIKIKSNLTSSEKAAITELKNNSNIIIKQADKNLGPTVLDREWYMNEAKRQLSDNKVYQPVTKVPFDYIQSQLKSVLDDSPFLTPQQKTLMMQPFTTINKNKPHIPAFYLTPKIHKKPMKGRPIVANHSWCLANVARYVDQELQPIVKRLPHVLTNTVPFLRTLESTAFPSNCLLVTADVSSLYTNIPHKQGLQAVRETLIMMGVPTHKISILCELLSLVLHSNYFQFGEQLFHQISGTAMGSQLAPCYANIFMSWLESLWLHKYNKSLSLYQRYLDDIFIVFNGDRKELSEGLTYFNSLLPSIKISSSISNQSAHFLDLTIFKGSRFAKEKKLDCKTFSKHLLASCTFLIGRFTHDP